MSLIVELEPGVWIADGEGDPPRTLDAQNAKPFDSISEASTAIEEARKYRPFKSARIH